MILGVGGKKTPFFVENRDFTHILLCAKFNRFFIILGGVQNDRKTTILVVLGSHILGFWGKIPQKP